MLTREAISDVFRRLAAVNPEPQTELESVNTYTLLVAVICSAQATDVGVNKATRALFPLVDTPQKMLDLGEEGLKSYIKTIGLFNSKAKNVIAMSQMLLDKHNGEVPDTLKELQALPGVGRKTANVILNCAFGQPTIAVDTHVFRVSNRIGIAKANNVEEAERQLLRKIPKEWLFHAHHWLILHGRYVCKARKPECANCTISDICEYRAKNLL
ncbi:MAG: endonuclease III [Alphaproteobacteria bacterium]|nr:endonuclease III [Alphaproteobacteria bacterium]